MVTGGCRDAGQPAQPLPAPILVQELVVCWGEDYLPQAVLDAFTAEYGVEVEIQDCQSVEEGLEHLRQGEAADVMVVAKPMVAALAASGELAEIDHRNVPNLSHLSPGFRTLPFDPCNRHSVTSTWGFIGLLTRTDRPEPVTSRLPISLPSPSTRLSPPW